MRILVFGDFSFPASCANAVRSMNLAKILIQLGHDVKLLGISYTPGVPETGVHESISYEHIQSHASSGIQSLKRVWLLDRKLAAYLDKYTCEMAFDAILLNDVYYDNARVFLKYARRNGSKLIVNAVEWFDAKNPKFSGIFGKIKLIKNRMALRYIHVHMKNILAISTLLGDFYSQRDCNTVVIPTLVDPAHYRDVSHTASSNIKIAYAGIPGKKDYIVNALIAVSMLSDEERNGLEIHLYGPSQKELEEIGLPSALMETCEKSIICHGKIPYDQVKACIADADFTILLRPNKRYANAGFPTKVGESMACGTPVIANLTSDLGKYIIDGVTGIVCENETAEACAVAYRRILNMSREQMQRMRIQTRKQADESFNYTSYAENVNVFFKNLRNCR